MGNYIMLRVVVFPVRKVTRIYIYLSWLIQALLQLLQKEVTWRRFCLRNVEILTA